MSKDPAFLFYSSDFLTGVAGLTMEERGQYITLMCLQHQHGRLPSKTICLSLGLKSVIDIPDVIKKFQKDENELYYQDRLEEEIEKRLKYADSRRLNGQKGGRPKKETPQNESTGKAYKKHMENHMRNHSENENENENKKEIKHKYGEYKNVLLTDSELEKLKLKFSDYEKKIEIMSTGIEMKGYKYKSHYLAILKWAKGDESKPKQNFAGVSYTEEQIVKFEDDPEDLLKEYKGKMEGEGK